MSHQLASLVRYMPRSRIAILVGAITVSFTALAEDLPTFKPGMWEFKRTVEGEGAGDKPMKLENKECTDPTAEMKKMNDKLAKQGCKFTPISRSGSTYSLSSDCQIQGMQFQSRSVITVESDSAYRVDVSSTGAGASTKELLIAKRVGECQP